MIFQLPREELEQEDHKSLFSGGQFKYPVGVVLSISWGGDLVDFLSGSRVWREMAEGA